MEATLTVQVAEVLKQFCQKFQEYPYLHRNEHSIHMQIADYLATLGPPIRGGRRAAVAPRVAQGSGPEGRPHRGRL